MAGRPLMRALKAQVERIGGLDVVFDRIAGGETITAIARELGVPRARLSGLLHSKPEWEQRLREAQKAAASAWAEEMLDIADHANPEDVKVRQLQVEVRKWLAGSRDPDNYGDRGRQQALQISAGAIHVAVLQSLERGGGARPEGGAGGCAAPSGPGLGSVSGGAEAANRLLPPGSGGLVTALTAGDSSQPIDDQGGTTA